MMIINLYLLRVLDIKLQKVIVLIQAKTYNWKDVTSDICRFKKFYICSFKYTL